MISHYAKDNGETQDPSIEFNGSLEASRFFIGTLEGECIGFTYSFDKGCPQGKDLVQRFLDQDTAPSILLEALQMADFYNIRQFKRFLCSETLPDLISMKHIYALSAFVVAMKVRRSDLAKSALEGIPTGTIPAPEDFGADMIEAVGRDVWECLIKARCNYLKAGGGTGGYGGLAGYIKL